MKSHFRPYSLGRDGREDGTRKEKNTGFNTGTGISIQERTGKMIDAGGNAVPWLKNFTSGKTKNGWMSRRQKSKGRRNVASLRSGQTLSKGKEKHNSSEGGKQ